jgi:hypothetical protein
VPKIFSGCGTPIDWCADSSADSAGLAELISISDRQYSRLDRPRPPYFSSIFIPNAPSSARPVKTSSGMLASRSICSPSTVRPKASSFFRNASPLAVDSGLGVGHGSINPSRSRPRKSCLPKLGFRHSVSRADSATWRA